MTADWLALARAAAERAPDRPRLPLRLGSEPAAPLIGSIEASLAERLRAALPELLVAQGGYRIQGLADAALARVAQWLRAERLLTPWRDELLDVGDEHGRVVARIERAAVRPLGIRTRAVHLSASGDGGGVWVQQRAFDKSTDPGLWDTLVGGQVAAGETVEVTLARETREEAGLELGQLRGLGRAATMLIRRPLPEGYMVEDIDVFQAEIPPGVVPNNRDGEVSAFECLDRRALIGRLAAGAFTLEATLILGTWLARDGAEGATAR